MRKIRKLRGEVGLGLTLIVACIPALVTGALALMLLSGSPITQYVAGSIVAVTVIREIVRWINRRDEPHRQKFIPDAP